MALAPAFGEYGLPVERLSGRDMRSLLGLPGVAAHPAVARTLSAALDTGPAWPPVDEIRQPASVRVTVTVSCPIGWPRSEMLNVTGTGEGDCESTLASA